MKPQRHNEQQLSRDASRWLETLPQADADERASFVEWLTESPRHVREFLLMTAFDRALSNLDPGRKENVAELLSKGAEDVVRLPAEGGAQTTALHVDRSRSGRNTQRYRWLTVRHWQRNAAIAASLALLGMLWFAPFMPWKERYYSTGLGEQHAFELEDGSLLHLNTQSKVAVKYSANERSLRLITGEALFKVARDTSRPFRVHTADAVIQAIGTQFNVYRKPNAVTQVAVLEGMVSVSAGSSAAHIDTRPGLTGTDRPLIRAGQEVRVAHGKITPTAADAVQAGAWRQRRLVFRGDSLEDVAMEFNRYNKLQIRIAGHIARRYTGVFDADDPASALQVLAKDSNLNIERSENEIVIRPRPPDEPPQDPAQP